MGPTVKPTPRLPNEMPNSRALTVALPEAVKATSSRRMSMSKLPTMPKSLVPSVRLPFRWMWNVPSELSQPAAPSVAMPKKLMLAWKSMTHWPMPRVKTVPSLTTTRPPPTWMVKEASKLRISRTLTCPVRALAIIRFAWMLATM